MFRAICSVVAYAWVAAIALVATAAAQSSSVHDSAGIRIIDNPSRADAPVAFTLSATPTFDLGGLKDNPDDEFDERNPYLRAIHLDDGTTVISDDTRLRFYDAAGHLIHLAGRAGEGPHEFRQVDALCRTLGDTIVAFDGRNARVEVLDRAGNFVYETVIGLADRVDEACLDDGSYLVSEYNRSAGARAVAHVVRRRLDGTLAGVIGDFDPGEFSIYLSAELSLSATGRRIYVGDPRSSEVKEYDIRGKLIAIIRTADPIALVTAAEASAMVPLAVGAGPGARPTSSFPKPTRWPSYHRVASDRSGRLWIEDYQKSPDAADSWTVFGADGRMLGRVQLPPNRKRDEPRWIAFTTDGVQMRRTDSDGASHVTSYALVPVHQ